jgi:hypothetical protein
MAAVFRLRRLSLILSALALNACGRAESTSPVPPATGEAPASVATPAPAGPVRLDMKNVRLHVAPGIVLTIPDLQGEMVTTEAGRPPVFDDQRSYVLHVASGRVSLNMAGLARLMNDHVFSGDDAPLTNVSVSNDEGRLAMKATLHKGIAVRVSTLSSVSPAPDGRIRLHTEKVSVLGLPATTLLELLHLSLKDVVGTLGRAGVRIEGDDILLTPGRVLPPPEMRGHIARAELRGDDLWLTFAAADGRPARPVTPPQPRARGYIYFNGASIRFGKLTMAGSDLQLIDADERDPFEFSPAQYQRQLIAGYSKNTAAGGLETYLPDLDDVPATGRGLRPPR